MPERAAVAGPAGRDPELVAGVGRDQQPLGAARLQALARLDLDLCDAVPIAGQLQRGVGGHIEALDRQQRAVQSAEPPGDPAIDVLVIHRRRVPARAADDPQLAQRDSPSLAVPQHFASTLLNPG